MSSRVPRTLLVAPVLIGLACLLTVVVPGTCGATIRSGAADQAQAGLAEIDSLLAAGQATAAVVQARRLQAQLGADPLYGWQVEGRLGLALLRAGNPAEALPHLEAVMRHHPHDPVAHRNFAVALLDLGRRGRALSEFQMVVELAPDDFEARLEYGQILAEFGDVAAARTQFEVARKLCPSCPEPDRGLGSLFLTAGKCSEALPPLQRLMDRDQDPWARSRLGQALAGAGRDEDLLDFLAGLAPEGLSAGEWNLAVEAEGRLKEADWSLACAGNLTDPTAVVTRYGPLADGLLTEPGFWGRVSLNLLEAGHFSEGLVAADQAVALDEQNAVYRNNRVVLLLKLGRDEEASREWEEALRLDPSLKEK